MKAHFRFYSRIVGCLLFLLLGLLYPATGFSLENDRWNTNLRFRFYPPGARALGMGGAFVGLADDATAAVSNPAGIAQLTGMQLAIEGRYTSQDKKSQSFNITRYNRTEHHTLGSNDSDVTEVSFGAFSTPLFDNLFNLSVFYNKPVDYSSSKPGSKTYSTGSKIYSMLSHSTVDFSVDEVGLSLAKSFFDGKVQLGFGLGVQFADLTRSDNRLYPELGYDAAASSKMNGTGVDWRVGILAKPIDNLRLGASLTVNPVFDYDVDLRLPSVVQNRHYRFGSQIRIPDNWAVGAAYNIFNNWVVQAEGRYIRYSQLEKGFALFENAVNSLSSGSTSDYSINDIMEIHFGTEYTLNVFSGTPISLRTGFYYEPAHDLKYNGVQPDLKDYYDGGSDLMHFTVGAGVVLFNHFQVDVGADFTEESRNLSMSMVYQF